ncbi:ATPase NPA3 [Microthyrium microscopicum]|uniref:GPN-loop GTPase n=1 Tax=Microthyrium microscopicum TaxID=703497 RepID=A0A6A6U9B8_9PEZI|nr:ATPase NPA3 [Microthyrium microscopicum]
MAEPASTPKPTTNDPIAIVCVGMAGSGKTTFMQRINAHLHAQSKPPYVINLDPAVTKVPFQSNIDIRDSVNYQEVMAQYKLGPNGGILTSLNLFATKVDQVVNILEKRTKGKVAPIEHIIVDTPGQIEVFVWSASGDIILGSLASSFRTVIAYIIDTPRSTSTSTFMSNMLYACSILYKTKLPMILVLNKADATDVSFAKEWMTDFEAFQAALREEEEGKGEEGGFATQGSGYMGSLLHSMSLVLDEFYKHLSVVGVSALTGQGVDEFFEAVQEKAVEFEKDYRPELERRKGERDKLKAKIKEKELGKMMADMNVKGGGGRRKKDEAETVSEAEEEDDNSDEDDGSDKDNDMSRRYQQALGEDEMDTSKDMSFVKYLQSSNIG